jgi:MoaA/NifB/PqqE/SkfB family radical SAM enzyme
MSHETLRAENADLNREEYASRRAELKSWPRMLFVELTQKCNAACRMCRQPGGNVGLPEMTFETFKSIADQAFPRAEVVDLRGWGESLIHPLFVQTLEYAATFGAVLKIYTNLSVPWKVCEHLVGHGVITAVSFDAADKELFERLREGCRFDVVVGNLRRLAAAARAKNRPELVYLSVTVQGDNLSHIPRIVALAGEIGVAEIKLFPIICDESEPAHLSHHVAATVEALDRAKDVAASLGVRLSCGAGMDESLTSSTHALAEPCLHPWAYCYIDPFGRLGFCDHLIGQQSFILASESADFHRAWNSEGFRRLRAQHSCGPKGLEDEFYPCRWCYGRRYMDSEHWIEPTTKCREVSSETTARLYERVPFAGRRLPFVSGLNR